MMYSRASRFSVWLAFLLMLGGCMPVMMPPQSLDGPDIPDFPGIADHLAYAISRDEPLNVVLVHGMSHGEAGSILVPTSNADVLRITNALGGRSSHISQLEEKRFCGVVVTPYEAELPEGEIIFHEINYTSYLLGNTGNMDLPASCSTPTTPFSEGKLGLFEDDQLLVSHATSLNAGIKKSVVTWGLSDAAVYLHQATREAIIQNVSKALKEIGSVTSNKPVVFIAKSLGSRVLFDSLNSMYDDLPVPVDDDVFSLTVPPKLTNTHTVYFLANQLPLLELGAPLTSQELQRISVVLQETFNDADPAAEAQAAAAECPDTPALYFVAISDPNDLLTFRITPIIDRLNQARNAARESGDHTRTRPEHVEFRPVDVMAGVAPVILGLVAHPGLAHSGHLLNHDVLALITERRLEAGSCPL